MVTKQTFSEPRKECCCRTRSKVLPMRRLFVRALTFNPSARRYAQRLPAGSLYRDRGCRGRASVSLCCHAFATAILYIVSRTCNTHVSFGPRWCARASPGCEDAAGEAVALPAHSPTLSPWDKHAAEVEEANMHSRDAVYHNSAYRKTANYPLATNVNQVKRRILRDTATYRSLTRAPLNTSVSRPLGGGHGRAPLILNDTYRHVCRSKSTTPRRSLASRSKPQWRTTKRAARTSLERLLRVGAGSYEDNVRGCQWCRCILGARSKAFRH